MAFTLDPERAEVRKAVDQMADCLGRIKKVAERERAEVLVLSVPPGWYVCTKALSFKRRIGFRLDDGAIHSDAPDAVIRGACRAANVSFCSFTSHFRKAAPEVDLYYDFDGHFNAAGHLLFGAQVSEELLRHHK